MLEKMYHYPKQGPHPYKKKDRHPRQPADPMEPQRNGSKQYPNYNGENIPQRPPFTDKPDQQDGLRKPQQPFKKPQDERHYTSDEDDEPMDKVHPKRLASRDGQDPEDIYINMRHDDSEDESYYAKPQNDQERGRDPVRKRIPQSKQPDTDRNIRGRSVGDKDEILVSTKRRTYSGVTGHRPGPIVSASTSNLWFGNHPVPTRSRSQSSLYNDGTNSATGTPLRYSNVQLQAQAELLRRRQQKVHSFEKKNCKFYLM
ncbi:hypothetical protein Ciccas_001008 [Cichlidogyrus casuarinus]|uniref:Uncharacterized protein n=1 Tax=Cichlidogyrus casuarinus TaxID=1844966 RepID=A0ABD2QLA2_9PLAT